jgi:uncharacterized protein YfiM (DUF2279 family)
MFNGRSAKVIFIMRVPTQKRDRHHTNKKTKHLQMKKPNRLAWFKRNKSSIITMVFLSILLSGGQAYSQSKQGIIPENPYGFEYPDSLMKNRAIISVGGIATTYTGMIFFMEYIWYRGKARAPFHFYNDNGHWLQMDKGGHAFSAYHESHTAYHLLRWAGYPKKTALWLGGSMGFFLQAPVDIWDGFYEGYGFSWGDILANTAGAALFTAQEAIWDEQFLRLKFSYSPSGYSHYNPGELGDTPIQSFFLDYNGHTQWISGSINRLTGIESIPAWLCISIGHSAGGMTDREFNLPEYPEIERYRQYFLSVDVDFARMNIRNPYLRGFLYLINILKVPAPALEYNRINGFRFRPLYY